MVTVRTKKELENALLRKEEKILVVGSLAEEFKKKKRRSKAAKLGGLALILGGVVALPFTGGASAAGIAAGASALTVGTVVISAAELAIIVGGSVALVGVIKGAKVTFNPDGSVTIETQKK